MKREYRTGEFYQDFLEEADTLLSGVAGHLLALSAPQEQDARSQLCADMLRSLHTLKGLCGMAGLKPASRLCHQLESVLKQTLDLSGAVGVLDLLLDSVRTLSEFIIASAPGAQATPEVAERLEQLELLLESREGAQELLPHMIPADHEKMAEARSRGHRIGWAIFVPSAEHLAQGSNVTHIRERLRACGELLRSQPLISGKSVRFAFLLAFAPGRSPEPCPGLTWSEIDGERVPAQAVPAAPAHGATVRVDVARLDEMMRLVGDLVVSRWRLQNALDAHPHGEALRESSVRIERQLRDLRRAVMRARMVPLSEVFGRMPLAVRDLARSSGRHVQLVTHGEETELDKVLVERLLDPLLHLVRNAIAHGIESPAVRLAAGKGESGTLTLSGTPQGESINIAIADDGQGLDLEKIARQARLLGWLGGGEKLDESKALDYICRAGFSTRSQAGLDAGRGMGLDVVSQDIQDMGGSLSLENRPGQGCTFRLRLPLTLTIVDALLVVVAGETYAVARDSVSEVLEIVPAQTQAFPGGELVQWRGGPLPLLRLRELLGSRGVECNRQPHALVHCNSERKIGFVVDQVVGLREVVVRAVTDPLVARPWLGGATELGDGTVALILHLPELSRLAAQRRQGALS